MALELKGQRVRILQPQRGARAEYLRARRRRTPSRTSKRFSRIRKCRRRAQARSLTDLADALELPEPPHRIECYDISNIQGTNPVASMVVFVEGRAKKSDYRKFKIQYDRGPNDFAMMQETLRRRLRYLRRATDDDRRPEDADSKRELAEETRSSTRSPICLLIDGGKGQLSAVVEVLEELDMTGIPVAGFAKEHEWLYLPGSVRADRAAAELAGAASGHADSRRSAPLRGDLSPRNAVRKAMTRSALDALAGVGPVRRKRLLTAFGSVAAIERAGRRRDRRRQRNDAVARGERQDRAADAPREPRVKDGRSPERPALMRYQNASPNHVP